jgi:hypothetical protein
LACRARAIPKARTHAGKEAAFGPVGMLELFQSETNPVSASTHSRRKPFDEFAR